MTLIVLLTFVVFLFLVIWYAAKVASLIIFLWLPEDRLFARVKFENSDGFRMLSFSQASGLGLCKQQYRYRTDDGEASQ